jgi:hypothetical protein
MYRRDWLSARRIIDIWFCDAVHRIGSDTDQENQATELATMGRRRGTSICRRDRAQVRVDLVCEL